MIRILLLLFFFISQSFLKCLLSSFFLGEIFKIKSPPHSCCSSCQAAAITESTAPRLVILHNSYSFIADWHLPVHPGSDIHGVPASIYTMQYLFLPFKRIYYIICNFDASCMFIRRAYNFIFYFRNDSKAFVTLCIWQDNHTFFTKVRTAQKVISSRFPIELLLS